MTIKVTTLDFMPLPLKVREDLGFMIFFSGKWSDWFMLHRDFRIMRVLCPDTTDYLLQMLLKNYPRTYDGEGMVVFNLNGRAAVRYREDKGFLIEDLEALGRVEESAHN